VVVRRSPAPDGRNRVAQYRDEAAARTGRPRLYCSRVCRERARTRVRRAARLREFAEIVEGSIGRHGFGSEEHLRERVASIRTQAAELVEGLPS
jgi:hypothetical protein